MASRAARLSVTFPSMPKQPLPVSYAEIFQGDGGHDVAKLYLKNGFKYSKILKTKTPIVIKWSHPMYSKTTGTFTGYIDHYTPWTGSQLNQQMVIYCVSASFDLNKRDSKVWVDKTAPEIVEEIAKKFKFKTDLSPHALRFPQVTMGTRTYWEFLKDLAKDVGFGFFCDGVTIVFKDKDDLIDGRMSTAPSLEHRNKTIVEGEIYKKTLVEFAPKVGDYLLVGETKLGQVIRGVDAITGEPFEESLTKSGKPVRKGLTDPLFQNLNPSTTAASAQMAKLMLKAKVNNSRFGMIADATALGNAAFTPYQPVYIKGTGEVTDGPWVVQKAVHKVTAAGDYETDLVLTTDGIGQAKVSAYRTGIAPKKAMRSTSTSSRKGLKKRTAPKIKGKSGPRLGGTNTQRWSA